MGRRYAVLWGQRGSKGFYKLPRAKEFARKKANKLGKSVEIDRITTYPKAKAGQVDWSQKYYSTVKPTQLKRKRSPRKPIRRKQNAMDKAVKIATTVAFVSAVGHTLKKLK